jgi:phenylacetate-CoA ligase
MTDTTSDKHESSIQEQFYNSLMASREISSAQLQGYQQDVAATYVKYICGRSAWHADRLMPVFKSDEPDFSRWRDVPILSKRELLDDYHRWRIDDIPNSHGRVLLTESSSSTGISVALPKTQMTDTATACASFRHVAAFGLDYARPLVMLRSLNPMLRRQRSHDVELAQSSSEPDSNRWGPTWIDEKQRGPRHYIHVSLPCDQILDRLDEIGRQSGECYLNTSPSKALELANHVRRNGRASPPLMAVLSVGEVVTASLRHEVKTHLGCNMIDIYATAETGPIAMQCPDSGLYHVQSELGLVELLSGTGQPARPGETGRVVVTPLYNLAMPLIRFDTGDLAIAGAACKCGSPHPVITSIVGRASSQLRSKDGKTVRLLPDFEGMRKHLGQCRWRLTQTHDGCAELQYMQTPDGEHIDEQGAISLVASLCSAPGLEDINLREIDVLGLTGGGKFAVAHRSVQ